MRILKAFYSNILKYLLWLVLSTMFWAWIFTFVRDTTADKKVVLYADVFSMSDRALDVRLEEEMPEGIEMIRVHLFSYAMFNDASLGQGDLYILPEWEVEEMIEDLAPLSLDGAYEYYWHEGEPYGILIYDAKTGTGIAQDYIQYLAPGQEPQNYYLFFGARSVHLDEQDETARLVARSLLSITGEAAP